MSGVTNSGRWRWRWQKSFALALLAFLVAARGVSGEPAPCRGIWPCGEDVRNQPMEGPAWAALLRAAQKPAGPPRLADQEDNTDVRVLAKALVYARTGDEAMRDEVVAICMAAIGSEKGGRTLAVGRNLFGYVISADIVGLPPEQDAAFRNWLMLLVSMPLAGRTLKSTNDQRPNNWGTHAGAGRLAAALYLGDRREVKHVAAVFHGWLGNRAAYQGFRFGALDWQAVPRSPVGINPVGALRDGHSIDGILPDDQRRCCKRFVWPAPKEPYVYEALQGALAQAV